MDNHVHLILVPQTADRLRAALGEAHRRYTRAVNFREGWRGYLFQGRFASYPMDDEHLMAAVRYVERNPVAAGLAAAAGGGRQATGAGRARAATWPASALPRIRISAAIIVLFMWVFPGFEPRCADASADRRRG